MLQTQLFAKIKKEAPKDEPSINAQLLTRGGYVEKLMSGVYSFLPLGFIVLKKIENIIREEMQKIGGQEILMPALQPKEIWTQTGRWETVDDLYKLKDRQNRELALGPTHEEVIVDIIRRHSFSYKDMPFALFQIQTKFRDELRSKSGLLRGREFSMKDLYSFHVDEEDRKKYYEVVKKAYLKIFKRCGLPVIVAEASGGTFSKDVSHEFQVPTDSGEDIVVFCQNGHYAKNIEIADKKRGENCPTCAAALKEVKSIEAGNIFTLGTKFSSQMKAYFTDRNGIEKPMVMGCYGIGLGRVLGAVVEAHNDERGIIWPKELAPYHIHLIALDSKNRKASKKVFAEAEKIYKKLSASRDVLYDDRKELSAGQKFAEADLIGAYWRIVVSEKTLTKMKVEIKKRNSQLTKFVGINECFKKVSV